MNTDPVSVQKKAYELWVQRGCPHGSAELDWMEAERLLRTAPAVEALASAQVPAPAVTRSAPRNGLRSLRPSTPPAAEAGPPEVATAAVAPKAPARKKATMKKGPARKKAGTRNGIKKTSK